jgi:hypothetical protein
MRLQLKDSAAYEEINPLMISCHVSARTQMRLTPLLYNDAAYGASFDNDHQEIFDRQRHCRRQRNKRQHTHTGRHGDSQ